MSKAFAPGESEDDEERIVVRAPVLPLGTPNYITPQGAVALEAERERLIAQKAALADTVEDKARGRVIDQRLAFLTDRLSSATVVDPQAQPTDQVRFGATVTIQNVKGEQQTWQIVGVDEVNFDKGRISWISPLARALQDKRVGDTAVLGDQKLTVQKIAYPG